MLTGGARGPGTSREEGRWSGRLRTEDRSAPIPRSSRPPVSGKCSPTLRGISVTVLPCPTPCLSLTPFRGFGPWLLLSPPPPEMSSLLGSRPFALGGGISRASLQSLDEGPRPFGDRTGMGGKRGDDGDGARAREGNPPRTHRGRAVDADEGSGPQSPGRAARVPWRGHGVRRRRGQRGTDVLRGPKAEQDPEDPLGWLSRPRGRWREQRILPPPQEKIYSIWSSPFWFPTYTRANPIINS